MAAPSRPAPGGEGVRLAPPLPAGFHRRMTAEELHSKLMDGARILALQRAVVALMARHLQCSLELADARFQEEWDRCFEDQLAKLETSLPSALIAECRHLHQQERNRWLNPQ